MIVIIETEDRTEPFVAALRSLTVAGVKPTRVRTTASAEHPGRNVHRIETIWSTGADAEKVARVLSALEGVLEARVEPP